MHILAEEIRSLDETVQAIDLGQTPGDIVFLSFTDSDLAQMAAAHRRLGNNAPSLRIANLAALRHPYAVDLYVEKVISGAKLVLVRCLGGMDYWRYGLDEIAATARAKGIAFCALSGDGRDDPRLAAVSTMAASDIERIDGWLKVGGPGNFAAFLAHAAGRLGITLAVDERQELAALACWPAHCGCGGRCLRDDPQADGGRPVVPILFYRAIRLAEDTEPVAMLAAALEARGMMALPMSVTSLKDPAVAGPLGAFLKALRPLVIVNTTAFAARTEAAGSPLEAAGAPVIQAVIASTFRTAWESGRRGLTAADLAMNLVLPEVDGRILGPAISFKVEDGRDEATQSIRVRHRGEDGGIQRAADLAAAWARLGALPTGEKRVALVLSNYPAKGGRTGYAVGLDGPASISAIAADLAEAGFDTGDGEIDGAALVRALEDGRHRIRLPLDQHIQRFERLPAAFRDAVIAAWGPVGDAARDGVIEIIAAVFGRLIIAVQPDRGPTADRAALHHDPNLAPPHAYVAFYLWLREAMRIDAMIHLGAHGTLEWLPGKAAALSAACAPAALTGALPVIYPFIVNNPGEAAQARRRISALPIGHLTPPLVAAGSHGATAEIEALIDEFAAAQVLDRRRADRLASLILDKARASGLAAETGLDQITDPAEALARLDAFLCDLKEMRIGDGLHVYGREPAVAGDLPADLVQRSAAAERAALIDALAGRFIPPGPGGAPSPTRLDVLPTGRTLHAIDPRAVPTRTALELGARTAEAVIARHVQDHGDWPRRLVIDLWGSATMRTGGEDLGQALALIGARPVWDTTSARVTGVEILAPARLGRPRVDVTLRISGLFRDVFPDQLALFDQAVRAVAARIDEGDDNPLAGADIDAEPRIYGAAPGAFGVGLVAAETADRYEGADDLGRLYRAASAHAYGAGIDGRPDADGFDRRVAAADGFVHVQDHDGQDILDSDAFADHEGGFAAAAASLGARPALYHVRGRQGGGESGPAVRTLPEEMARVLRGRAANPRWIEGQLRHGHRGAAEIAETVGNLVAFAATAGIVAPHQFDLIFDATLGNERVRGFMIAENPQAAAACARAFDRALRRGYWPNRRNSVAAAIGAVLETAS